MLIEMKTPADWLDSDFNYVALINRNGWSHQNWSDSITKEEFQSRLSLSEWSSLVTPNTTAYLKG